MNPRPADARAVRDSLLALQGRRVRQLIVLLMSALGLFAAINVTVVQWPILLSLVGGVALLGFALRLQQGGKVEESLLLVLWVMTLVCTALIWMRSGIRDLVVFVEEREHALDIRKRLTDFPIHHAQEVQGHV